MSEYIRKRVEELFGGGQLYCAETVLGLIAEAGGREAKDVVPLATGFCSGAARTCGQCGAVSGAIMGIGLFAGRSEPGGDYEPCYALVQEFLSRFNAAFGSINCLELTGCDFASEADRERFKEERIVVKCFNYAVTAVDMALTLLREEGYLPEREDFIRSRLAPCGLSCGSCLAFAGGPIQRHAKALQALLGENFAAYAKRFEGMNPVFENYSQFEVLLGFLGQGSCSGCREQGCLFLQCKVPACCREHRVDYCHQCEEFPCDVHGMPEGLAERWRINNEKMRELGVATWYQGCCVRPRYP
ncbi:DUF3795 domain-containing protein [Pseudodesulfovibrio cashew]|uniref:DUF3795 domain-containing protein n=1 Tax=Pseudodesulfovibrio cashew TaxID=2678688 RepID=A0A6I6JBZ7_9BACT|nr:C-GCAxxG-C-C family (seleno)protein [Pseudodesulfovibrio cashew]QGY39621.1 DUF3795 domain-containing protein [Pseudodesulfovibrio cashew]